MRRLLGGAAALLALVSCRSPTQISIEVSTNVPCGSWQGAAVAVGQLGTELETKPAATTSTYCDSNGYLGTVVAVPSGADNASVGFRIVGAVTETLEACTEDASGSGCIVARRALNFIPHDSLAVSVPLLSSCEGIVCDPESTCVQGTCKSATIADPSACASSACGESALGSGTNDGGTASDAGAIATKDATTGADDGSNDAGASADAIGPVFDAAGAACEGCALALGENHTCVLRDGGVVCWGQNDLGQIGNGGGAGPGPGPVLIDGGAPLSGAIGVATGWNTACAFVGGGTVACWGGGSTIGLAYDTQVVYATPQPPIQGASLLALADKHGCWLTGGSLTCVTYDGYEDVAFGDPDASTSGPTVVTVPPPSGAVTPYAQVVSSPYFTCVLDGAGRVYCLGDDSAREVDPNSATSLPVTSFVPVSLPASTVDELSVLEQATCARAQGHVYCWGNSYMAATGGLPDGGSAPVNEIGYADQSFITNAVKLASGETHTCALLQTQQVVCWGDNTDHQLGRGEPIAQPGGTSTVAQIVALGDGGAFGGVTDIGAGGLHSCAMTSDGSLWCWGENDNGESVPADPASAISAPERVTY